jgi:hypothetical protein
MTVTAFGGLFLPLSLFVYLFRRTWLLPLLCVAAVLQSPSVLNVDWRGTTLGITPFFVVASLVAGDLLRRIGSQGRLCFGEGTQRRLLMLWLGFGAVAIVGALVLPWLFAGIGVLQPLDKDGVLAQTTPLSLSISNFAQILNLVLILTAMLWVVQQRRDPDLSRRMWMGVVAAVAISSAIGLQQRLGWNGLLPLWESFWASNPTYAQNYRTWAGPVPRVSWPLVEASYGSAWYAAVFGGFVAMFLAGIRRNLALLGAFVALFGLGNSAGATGMLAMLLYLGVVVAAVVVVMIVRPHWRGALIYRMSVAGLAGTCALLASYLVLRNYGLLDEASLALRSLLHRWNQTVTGEETAPANREALQIAADTWGLGVGMGSNRASSYIATLIGNMGLPGLVLFGAAIGYQFYLLAGLWRRHMAASAVFFLGSGSAGLIAVAIAIPDQNWPVFWMLILGGVACLGIESPARCRISQSTQGSGHGEADDRAVQPDVDQRKADHHRDERAGVLPEHGGGEHRQGRQRPEERRCGGVAASELGRRDMPARRAAR